jgi:YidC/Oxa1 family membrane protein insertase
MGNLAVAIIFLTIAIRLIFLPLSKKSIQSQKSLQELQPKMEELKKKYKDDREKLGREMMALYKEHNINPFSSCLPLLIQLPFFISIFQIFKKESLDSLFHLIYPFIKVPGEIDTMIFSFLDLSHPNGVLAVMVGLAQFIQTKMLMSTKKPAVKGEGSRDESAAAMMNKQMVYFMPVFIVIIGFQLPAALMLYMLTFNISMIVQQMIVLKKKKGEGDTAEAS